MATSSSIKQFTQGNIYSQLFALSVPLILGNILQQFYNTIDAFVVGRYAGTEEFAAIGIAGTIMNLFLFLLVGACTGLSVLFARYYGTGDYGMLQKQHFAALCLGLLFSMALCATGLLSMKGLLVLMQTPAEIVDYVCHYLTWIFISLPAVFIYNMYAAALRASGDTLAALGILTAAVCSNLVLDLLFVAHMGLGIRGAAQATAITQLISAVLCLLYLSHCHREFLFHKKDCRMDTQMLRTTIQCSLATAIHQGSLYIGKTLVQGTINTGGLEVISAYTAATRIEGFANSFGDSCSAATSVIVSQSYGAHNHSRIRKSFHCSLRISASLGLLCGLVMFVSSRAASGLMLGTSANTKALLYAADYLKLIALFYLLCFTGSTFTGYFNGLGKVYLTLCGSLGQIIIRVVLSWLLFHSMKLNAVALATGIGWFCANLFWLLCRAIGDNKKANFPRPHWLYFLQQKFVHHNHQYENQQQKNRKQ